MLPPSPHPAPPRAGLPAPHPPRPVPSHASPPWPALPTSSMRGWMPSPNICHTSSKSSSRMATALSSSSELWAGLQSTDTTCMGAARKGRCACTCVSMNAFQSPFPTPTGPLHAPCTAECYAMRLCPAPSPKRRPCPATLGREHSSTPAFQQRCIPAALHACVELQRCAAPLAPITPQGPSSPPCHPASPPPLRARRHTPPPAYRPCSLDQQVEGVAAAAGEGQHRVVGVDVHHLGVPQKEQPGRQAGRYAEQVTRGDQMQAAARLGVAVGPGFGKQPASRRHG